MPKTGKIAEVPINTNLVILDELGYSLFSTSRRRAAVPSFEQALRAQWRVRSRCGCPSPVWRMGNGVQGAKMITARLDRLPIPELDEPARTTTMFPGRPGLWFRKILLHPALRRGPVFRKKSPSSGHQSTWLICHCFAACIKNASTGDC